MSNDNLDTLPDAELSEVFAIEVAGYIRTETPDARTDTYDSRVWTDQDGNTFVSSPYSVFNLRKYGHEWEKATFAASADAVIPYLDTYGWDVAHMRCRDGTTIRRLYLRSQCHEVLGACEVATTFPRAACIALIRAKRAEQGRAK